MGVVANINIFTKTSIFWENTFRQIIIKMHSNIYQINHYSKMYACSKIYASMLQNALNNIYTISNFLGSNIIEIPACS